ncbi:MAG TPA: CHAD domain-containing protein [Acidimicrobiales bacterium]|nr:CHAD domain-containing protein [Acidimicrobiales bacterium]
MNKLESHHGAIEFALEALARSGGNLADAYRVVREGAPDPVEAVHDLRVAIRRVRADLRIFAKVFEGEWLDATQRRLRDLGRMVGQTRDVDVIAGRLEQLAETLPDPDQAGAERLLARLRLDRDVALQAVLASFATSSPELIVDELVGMAPRSRLAAAADEVDTDDLLAATRRQWKRLRKAARAAKDEPTVENLHKVRLRAKTLRYSLETLEPLFGSSADEHAKALVRLQDHLGEMQDAVVIEHWLRAARDEDAANEFVLGEFVGLERARRESMRSSWRDEWRRASGKRLRRWAK